MLMRVAKFSMPRIGLLVLVALALAVGSTAHAETPGGIWRRIGIGNGPGYHSGSYGRAAPHPAAEWHYAECATCRSHWRSNWSGTMGMATPYCGWGSPIASSHRLVRPAWEVADYGPAGTGRMRGEGY
jgi:hypothetical protein